MFNERDAIKMRLEQIQEIEIRIIQEFQKERSQILDRIRELDEGKPAKQEIIAAKVVEKGTSKKRKYTKKNKQTPLTKEAIRVLKSHSAAISGKELTNTVERNTGKAIANVTLFMDRVMNLDSNVKKPYRGQYIYEKVSASEETNEENVSVEVDQ